MAGPSDNGSDYITGDLVCTNGSWVFTKSGISTAITEVSCMLLGQCFYPDLELKIKE